MTAAQKALGSGNNDFVDGLVYPVLAKLQRFIPKSVTPNSITVMGFVMMVVGCLCLVLIRQPVALLAFALFAVLSNAFDGLDGIHARNTKQTSKLGDFLDHFFDQLSTLLVSFSLLLRFDLFTPVYVGIMMSVITINTLAFVYKSLTGYLHIGRFGPSTSLALLCIACVVIFVSNDPVLYTFHPESAAVAHFLETQRLASINIGKLIILFPSLSLPFSFYMFYPLAKKHVADLEKAKA